MWGQSYTFLGGISAQLQSVIYYDEGLILFGIFAQLQSSSLHWIIFSPKLCVFVQWSILAPIKAFYLWRCMGEI